MGPMMLIKAGSSPVLSVTFSPLGLRLASGDRSLRLWDLSSGREERKFTGAVIPISSNDEVHTVRFSPDGHCLFSGSWDIRMCDVESGSLIGVLTVPFCEEVYSVDTSPIDGRSLVCGGDDYAVSLWDTRTRQSTRSLPGHEDFVVSVAFSPDGQTVASVSRDGSLMLWDVATGTQLMEIANGDRAESVAFSPDGATVAYGIDDVVELYDSVRGFPLPSSRFTFGQVTSLAFASDRYLASGGSDTTVRIWDLEGGTCIRELTGHSGTAGQVMSVDFSKDGEQLVSGSVDRTVRVWDTGLSPV